MVCKEEDWLDALKGQCSAVLVCQITPNDMAFLADEPAHPELQLDDDDAGVVENLGFLGTDGMRAVTLAESKSYVVVPVGHWYEEDEPGEEGKRKRTGSYEPITLEMFAGSFMSFAGHFPSSDDAGIGATTAMVTRAPNNN